MLSQDIPLSGMRLMLRLANAFVLDVFMAVRTSGDFTDSVLMTALAPGHMGLGAAEIDHVRGHAHFDTALSESLRRPISVNAVATSLGLPFETVRRRLKALVAAGVCEATEDGVRFSVDYLRSDAHRQALEALHRMTRAFYVRLREADCLPLCARQAALAPPLPASAPPVRIVWRAVACYALRMMELLLPGFDSPQGAFVSIAVVTLNTRDIPDSVRGGDSLEPSAFVSDTLRRPARASEVADLLGMPYETVRRNLARFVEDGRCRRMDKGFIMPAEAFMRPRLYPALVANITNLNRMWATLAQTGVLAFWDAEPAAVAG